MEGSIVEGRRKKRGKSVRRGGREEGMKVTCIDTADVYGLTAKRDGGRKDG